METLTRARRTAIVLVALTSTLSTGCWDPIYGPAIKNGYQENVQVDVRFKDRSPNIFNLKPGQVYWQRTQQINTTGLVIVVTSSNGAVTIAESDLNAAGLSRDKPVLVVSPSGLRAEKQ